MKVTVIGSGYVGLVTGVCLSELGFHVICVDKDIAKVEQLRLGKSPIYEPGLESLLERNLQDKRLRFESDIALAIDHADVIFIAVGTPPREDGSADLSHVLAVARSIGQHMKKFKLVINKSTVPVGTADRVREAIGEVLQQRGLPHMPFDVVSNPEFLKEGAAIEDFMRPDRVVVGINPGPHQDKSRRMMSDLYASFNRHHERTVWMDVRSAELTKYAANAMLATRISFMNEMANLCDQLHADVDMVRRGIGADSRIGYSFLYAGCGYGGSCFPKDTLALVQTAQSHQIRMRIVEATEDVNRHQKNLLVERLLQELGPDLTGRNIAIWGLAFKPNTDDMREAPSRTIIAQLLKRGAKVQAFDPIAQTNARHEIGLDLAEHPEWIDRLQFVEHEMQAIENTDALLIVTEWKHFHNPDFEAMRMLMRTPLVLDGRNLYNPDTLQDAGIAYRGIGRRNQLTVGVYPQTTETSSAMASAL